MNIINRGIVIINVYSQKQLYGRPKTRERFQLHFLPLIDKEATFDISSGKQDHKGEMVATVQYIWYICWIMSCKGEMIIITFAIAVRTEQTDRQL